MDIQRRGGVVMLAYPRTGTQRGLGAQPRSEEEAGHLVYYISRLLGLSGIKSNEARSWARLRRRIPKCGSRPKHTAYLPFKAPLGISLPRREACVWIGRSACLERGCPGWAGGWSDRLGRIHGAEPTTQASGIRAVLWLSNWGHPGPRGTLSHG